MKSIQWDRFLRLLRYGLPYRWSVLTQFGLMFVAVGLGLLKPWPLKFLIDHVVAKEPLHIFGELLHGAEATLLLIVCAGYVLVHTGDALTALGSRFVATRTSARMIRDLRSDLLRHLQAHSLRFHDGRKVGDSVYRLMWNTSAVETAFQSGFMGTVKSLVMLVGMFVIMMAMSVQLTLIALVIVPFLVLAIRGYARKIHLKSAEHQEQEGLVSSVGQEILSSIRLIKAFGREADSQKQFESVAEESVGTRVQSTLTEGRFGVAVALTLASGTALLFFTGIRLVLAGQLTIGEFLVFHAYLGMLYSPLSVLSYTASSVQSSLGGASRLFEILDEEIEIRDRDGARGLENVSGKLEVEGVSFGYESGAPVLRDVSFSAAPGHSVAIVGQTGCGKSTLLNLLMRFYEPCEGVIRLDGIDVRDLKLTTLRDAIAVVPQEQMLLSSSIAENIGYGRTDATDTEIRAAAEEAQAAEFIERLSKGYDTQVGERGVRLSVGQRQRTALARALVKKAPILLLDEPTSALDTQTEARIAERLQEWAKTRTVVMAVHQMGLARLADEILVVSDGEVIEKGTHEDLLNAQGEYARMWGSHSGNAITEVAGLR